VTASVAFSSRTSVTTSTTLSPPSGMAVGDVMMIIGYAYANSGAACSIPSLGSWNVLSAQTQTRTTPNRSVALNVWWKLCVTSEPAVTVAITGTGRMTWTYITGAASGATVLGSAYQNINGGGSTALTFPQTPTAVTGVTGNAFDVFLAATETGDLSAPSGWTQIDAASAIPNGLGDCGFYSRQRPSTTAETAPTFTSSSGSPVILSYTVFTVRPELTGGFVLGRRRIGAAPGLG
jgi:hypothetical protein